MRLRSKSSNSSIAPDLALKSLIHSRGVVLCVFRVRFLSVAALFFCWYLTPAYAAEEGPAS